MLHMHSRKLIDHLSYGIVKVTLQNRIILTTVGFRRKFEEFFTSIITFINDCYTTNQFTENSRAVACYIVLLSVAVDQGLRRRPAASLTSSCGEQGQARVCGIGACSLRHHNVFSSVEGSACFRGRCV